MAELTVPTFFDIQDQIEHGLDLEGNPQNYDVRRCLVSRDDVSGALRFVESNYPELREIMQVAIALQCHLDTIRAETKLQLGDIRSKIGKGDSLGAIESLNTLRNWLGVWGEEHKLYVH